MIAQQTQDDRAGGLTERQIVDFDVDTLNEAKQEDRAFAGDLWQRIGMILLDGQVSKTRKKALKKQGKRLEKFIKRGKRAQQDANST